MQQRALGTQGLTVSALGLGCMGMAGTGGQAAMYGAVDIDEAVAWMAGFQVDGAPVLADGGGGIGPNLTDDYWIHGGNLADVYKTIKLGWPDKGMQAWQSVYDPAQIRNLASFVKSLKGTKPANPKAPQGDAFTESSAAPAAKADSAAAAKPAADSATKK
jgi:hypothetical protein